jgi:hypothetical protein
MAQPKTETIKKQRGKLNAAIELLREHGVPDEEIAERIVKAAKAEHGDDAARFLQALYADQVAESGSPTHKAYLRRSDASGAILTNIPGATKLTHGAGTFRFDATPATVAKSRKTRDEDARDEEIAQKMRKVRADIHNSGPKGATS